jgi:CHAT domain-containing protein/tetratricopeptide (TPR) repeat protein
MNTRREAAAVLTAGLLLAVFGEPPPVEKAAAPAGPPAVRILSLAPGILDEALLKGGEERAYLLDLAAGQYAELVIDQQGIDVAVSLQASEGRIVAAADSFNGILGPEPLPVVAETGGRFRLAIRSLTPGAPAGRSVLRLAAVRPATARDRVRVKAERMLAESVQLYLEDVPRSLWASLAQAREALARFHALGLPGREAEALFCLAKSHEQLGEEDAATGFYRQALPLFDGQGDQARVGVILSNLGNLERASGRVGRALALYREALPLHRRFHNRSEEALTLHNLGRAAMDLGETGEAVLAFEQALSLERSLGNEVSEGKTLSDLGSLEMYLGQTERALDRLGQAVALLESLGDRRGLGVALAHLGAARAFAGHSREQVLAAFLRALRIQREAGDRRGEALTLHNLGWYHRLKGELHQAELIFRETLATFQAQGHPAGEAAALVNLGSLDLELGRLAQAEESFTRARTLLAGIGDPAQEAIALLGLAKVRRAAGRPAEALTAIEGASAHIEAMRRKPADLGLRLTFFASKQEVYGLRVDLLMELHRRDPRAGSEARALLASEEARARTLLDLLDEVRVAEVREIGRIGPLGPIRPMTLREIQRQVAEPGSLLLVYFLGRERSFLWAVTSGTIESFELPPREVLEAEARQAAFLQGASGRALARRQAGIALAHLSQRLLGPVAHRLRGAERLVIVPDGALWSISFAALPDPSGPIEDRPPLVVGHEIVTLPALSVLPRLRRDAGRRPPPGTIAVVADPVFGATDPRVALRPPVSRVMAGRRSHPVAELARLPFSRAEAEAILSVAPPRGRLAAFDFAASRETVASGRLARYRIVHFATHAVLNTENPALSGIVLSGVDPQGRPRDGLLRLDEIYRLHLPADLVVLSACRTALGQEVRGEGLIGLTRGFFSAGARQVLVSLWPVDDRATAELMRRFYFEMLGRGRPAAAALRAAQTSMWRDESWRSAETWAGFTLQGDWRSR